MELPATIALESHGVLRLRSIPPAPAWNSAQNDSRLEGSKTPPSTIRSLAFVILTLLVCTPIHAASIETLGGDVSTGKVELDNGAILFRPDKGAAVKLEFGSLLRVQFDNPGTDEFAPGVLLRSGVHLAAPHGPLSDAMIKFPKRNISIPVAEIAWVIYQRFPAVLAANAPAGKTGALLPGGDFFEGTIKGANADAARLLNPIFGPRTLEAKNRDLLALVLRDARPLAAQYEIRVTDGSVFGAETFGVDRNGVTLRHPLFDNLTLAASELVEIRAGTARCQPLTALAPARAEPLPGRTLAECFAVDKTLGGEPLTSLGAAHGRGFEAAVNVAATWEVPAGFAELLTTVVVAAGTQPAHRFVFAVYADGRPVGQSAPLSAADPPQKLRVMLGSARIVSLRVEARLPKNATGSGLWLEPMLIRR